MSKEKEQSLLRAVVDDPDNDSPRLAYAAWLDKTRTAASRDRAKFIRIQCRIAQLPDNSPDRQDLTNREQALLKVYAKRWAEPFRELVYWWAFRRGFLDSAAVRTERMGERFLPLFRQLIEGTPLRGIVLAEQFGQPEVLLPAAPYMTRLREFTVRNGHLDREGAAYRKLLRSPHLAGLCSLDLAGPRDGSWFRPLTLSAILKSPVLSKLSSLMLSDYLTKLHPAVMSAVAKSKSLAGLRRLGFRDAKFDRKQIRAFAGAPFANNLEVLELQHCTLGQDAWKALLSDGTFPNLKRLFLAQATICGVRISAKRRDCKAIREQARSRFGPDRLDFEQEFPVRPWYYSWWEG